MSMHPLTANEVARTRSEEKVARGLDAYRALQAYGTYAPNSERWNAFRARLRRRRAERLSDPSTV